MNRLRPRCLRWREYGKDRGARNARLGCSQNPSLATILNARAQFPPNIPTPTKVHILTRDQC